MKSILTIVGLFITSFALAQSDDEAVKATINSAYIGGIHNGGPIEDIRKGFHPSFIMFILNNNEIKSTTIDEWIGNIEKARTSNSNPPANKAVAKFTNVVIAGTAASATLELYRGEKRIFTDNLLLYKFNEGWRIVGKNFYRHP